MPAKKLSEGEVQERLKKIAGWSLSNGKLHREFQCKRLCGGVRKHDAGGVGRGIDEPSSGMVQCVEQSSDRFETRTALRESAITISRWRRDQRDFRSEPALD